MTAGAALLLANGCGKEEPPASEPPKMPDQPAAASEAVKAVSEAATDAQKAVQSAATQAVAQATSAASAASAQAQGLIDKATALVTDQKYPEAMSVVQQLSSLKLTPEQQKLVDDLKAKIQAALAKATAPDAASAVGNVLGGKK